MKYFFSYAYFYLSYYNILNDNEKLIHILDIYNTDPASQVYRESIYVES